MSRPEEDILWGEDGPSPLPGSNTPIDPGPSLRETGYGFEQGIPHEEFNWLMRAHGRWLDYLDKVRAPESLESLIRSLRFGDYAPLSDSYFTGELVDEFNFGDEIIDFTVDGLFIYMVQRLTATVLIVRKVDIRDGSITELGSISDVRSGTDATIAANGKYVVVGYTVPGPRAEVEVFNAEEESSIGTVEFLLSGLTYHPTQIVLNHESAYIFLDGSQEFLPADIIARVDLETATLEETTSPLVNQGGVTTRRIAASGKYLVETVWDGSDGAVIFREHDDINETYWGAPIPEINGEVTNISIDNEKIYIYADNEVITFSAQDTEPEITAIQSVTMGIGIGKSVGFDVDSIFFWVMGEGAGPGNPREVFFIPRDIAIFGRDPERFTALTSFMIPDSEIVDNITIVVSDGQRFYCLVEDDGEYFIRILSKGPATKIWKRLDPESPFSWTRTLAAPI